MAPQATWFVKEGSGDRDTAVVYLLPSPTQAVQSHSGRPATCCPVGALDSGHREGGLHVPREPEAPTTCRGSDRRSVRPSGAHTPLPGRRESREIGKDDDTETSRTSHQP